MHQSFLVIDDFYDDAMEVRRRALELDFLDSGGKAYFAGRESRMVLLNDAIVTGISRLIGHPLVPSPNSANGHFRISLADDRPRQDVHVDPGRDWAGVLYLTLPEHCQGGTSFFRHKELGIERMPSDRDEIKRLGFEDYEDMRNAIVYGDGHDRSKWEVTMSLPMQFNRLVLFRSWLWHSFTENFGDTLDNGRLIQIFFFDYAGVRPPRDTALAGPRNSTW